MPRYCCASAIWFVIWILALLVYYCTSVLFYVAAKTVKQLIYRSNVCMRCFIISFISVAVLSLVYTIQPVWQPVGSCKRGFRVREMLGYCWCCWYLSLFYTHLSSHCSVGVSVARAAPWRVSGRMFRSSCVRWRLSIPLRWRRSQAVQSSRQVVWSQELWHRLLDRTVPDMHRSV